MPNTPSTIKRLKQDRKKHAKNKIIKNKIKILTKKLRMKKNIHKNLNNIIKIISKMSKKKIIARKRASEKISKLMKEYTSI